MEASFVVRKHRGDRRRLFPIAARRRGRMRRHVINVRRPESATRERGLHRTRRAFRTRRQGRQVKRIRRRTVPAQLRINPRAASLRMFPFLEDKHHRALAQNETIAVLVVGPRGFFRCLVPRRERPHLRKRPDRQRRHCRLRPARHHHIDIATRDRRRRFAERVSTRRTRRGHAHVRPPGVQ